MDDAITELKMKNFEEQLAKITKQLEEMPSKISDSVDDSVNLKIENATQKLTISFYKWLVPIILGLLFSFAGTIFNFIR